MTFTTSNRSPDARRLVFSFNAMVAAQEAYEASPEAAAANARFLEQEARTAALAAARDAHARARRGR